MINVSSAEINAWLAAYFFPLARILALLVASPPFDNLALTVQVRLILGLAIAIALAPVLPSMPRIDPASAAGLLLLAREIFIGLAIGFVMRLVFAAVDMAGNLISLQMGLGFASSYDPQSAGQTAVVSEFLGLLALLTFLAINGHLMVIATLLQSFTVLPVSTSSLPAEIGSNLATSGAIIFSSGLLLALPVVVALLITNLALAILSRAAPQLNLMAIGFPLTIALGFTALMLALPYASAPIQHIFEGGLAAMLATAPVR